MLIPLKELRTNFDVELKGVLHLGAHHGQEAAEYDEYDATEVVWIEANVDVKPFLEQTLAKYDKQSAFYFLISDKDGAAYNFNITNNEQSSSILELGTHRFKHPEVENVEQRQLLGKRLDRFIEEENINISEFNFLNIDLQGSELVAMKSLGKHLHNFKYIYTEVNINHLYKNCPLVHEIDAFLYKNNFLRKELRLFSGEKGWGDALYIQQDVRWIDYFRLYLEARIIETKQKTKDFLRQMKRSFKNLKKTLHND